jgi:alkylhydroperoxidase family enzyme
LDDDTIASLDSDWSVFEPRQRAALTFSRKLTLEPHLVGEADIAALTQWFTDVEIIELTFHIARFNAMNRWADGLGLPQEHRAGEGRSFETPTSERFQKAISVVAPTERAARPQLPSLKEVKVALAACRERQARVSLLSEDQARQMLTLAIRDRSLFCWERAMAQFAGAGPPSVHIFNTMVTDDHLSVRLKAELALISAIHNRAWYAAGHAAHRLHGLGVSADEMAAVFETFPRSPEVGRGEGKLNAENALAHAAVYRLAARLTAEPHTITDADIAAVRNHFSDAETAQIVHVISMANLFDRFTEALGLRLEEGICE